MCGSWHQEVELIPFGGMDEKGGSRAVKSLRWTEIRSNDRAGSRVAANSQGLLMKWTEAPRLPVN